MSNHFDLKYLCSMKTLVLTKHDIGNKLFFQTLISVQSQPESKTVKKLTNI